MIDEPGPLRDSKSNLLEAARAAVKDREEKAVADVVAARSVPRRRRMGLMGTIGIAGLVLLLLQPAWLAGPGAPPPETAPIATASLRLTLLRERQRVVDYNRRHGRLPETLADAGGSLPDIRYERTGVGEFRLVGQAGDSSVVLLSSDSMRTFLGSSLTIIKNRGPQ